MSFWHKFDPENYLRQNAASFFTAFQKNNKPSMLSEIKEHTTPEMYDAVSKMILEAPENHEVVVQALETIFMDFSEHGSGERLLGPKQYLGSVRFIATLNVTDNGETYTDNIDEIWNFLCKDDKWALAGITPV